MIPLPDANWVRSTKHPQYAVCFDPQARHFLWKMIEGPHDRWVGVAKLSPDELRRALALNDAALEPFETLIREQVAALAANESDQT